MEKTVFISLPIEDLQTVIIDCVNACLRTNKQANAELQNTTGKELLTRKQAAAFLGVTLPTLHKWTLSGRVKGRRIGSRVRYYQSDLEKALQAIKTQ